MIDENSQVKDSFQVSGYDVRARVISSGSGDPISGVEFTLYNYSSASASLAANPSSPTSPSSAQKFGEAFSKSRSDDGGRAVFTNIPRGCFLLVPSFADQATFFEFQPTSLQIEVGHGSVVIDNPFKVVGFNMYGRVSHKNGEPIEDVEILVDGKPSARTDADGFYIVEKMTTGTFDIVAKKDHVSFNSLFQFPVTANEPSLPEITAEGYDVCGEVVIPSLPKSVTRPKTIKIGVSSEEDFDKKFETSPLDADAYPFCVHLPLSDFPYTLSPLLPRVLAETGIMFTDEHHTVRVTNSPVFDVSFSQFLPSLSGKVECIGKKGKCSSYVTVAVMNGGEVVKKVVMSESGKYSVDGLFPGSYSVKISESTDGVAAWCWEKRERKVVLGRKKAADVDFVQKGFSVGVSSSVSGGKIVVKKGGKEEQVIEVVKGKSVHCLKELGKYEFIVDGCYRLPSSSSELSFDTSKKERKGLELVEGVPTIAFNPDASLVEGQIEVAGGKKDVGDVFVKIMSSSQELLEKVKAVAGKKKDGMTTFTYQYWNKKSQRDLVVVPEIASSSMLLYPSSAIVKIQNELECGVVVPKFSVRKGMYVEGVVNPAMVGVKVDILNKETKEVLMSTETKKGGKYSAGPLYDSVEYEAAVKLAGYHLEQDASSPFVFFARRLASVKVEVVDSSSGAAIEGVLLSLSGKGYRQNLKTDEEGGIEFLSLSPGTYFLKPMLKEYIFEPRQLSLDIAEGSQHPVKISAVRLEYSCYGKVTSLNNAPLGRVVVEAKAEDDHEETQTDMNGNYRLRGLVPGKQYAISLKNTKSEGGDQQERYEIVGSVPGETTVLAEKKDIRDMNFIAYGRSKLGSLTGVVEVEESFADSVKLEVFKAAGSALNLVKEVPIRAVKYFEVSDLAVGTYVIKMTSSLPSNQFRYSDVKKTVVLEEGDVVKHVELEMNIMLEDDFTDGTVLPYPFLFVLLLGVYCIFNREAVAESLSSFQKAAPLAPKVNGNSFIPDHIHRFSQKKQQQGKKGRK